ncbi:MAG TPA: hypothetical protein ENI79_02155 [Rhodospirillales bacterium]|nr:hypothetical protein [Rhodospirillales bacterium]
MPSDASIASQVEEWAVATLTTANNADKPFKVIEQYDGTVDNAGSRIAEEIVSASRNPLAQVFMLNSFMREQGDQNDDRLFNLFVFIGVRNVRGGKQSRCGDGDTIGIHRAMEFVADALDGGNPGKSDPGGVRKAVKVKNPEGNILFEQKTLYVATVRFTVRATLAGV